MTSGVAVHNRAHARFEIANKMSLPTRFTLSQKDIPTHWYNLLPDFPEPLPPPLHPGTKEPLPPEALLA